MGIFNFFTSSLNRRVVHVPAACAHVFNNNPLYVVMLGGASLLVAALLWSRVGDTRIRMCRTRRDQGDEQLRSFRKALFSPCETGSSINP
jgi:hypothetical protein